MHGATAEQMLILSKVLTALSGDYNGFMLLSKHGTFMCVSESDGCLSLEWLFDHMRIAVDIDKDLETSWSLSSDRNAGLYSEGGYIPEDQSLINLVAKRIYQ